MLRFIFVCMGVVALSLVAIGAQYMTDGISGEADSIMARNQETTQDVQAVAAIEEQALTPEALNAIETAAGETPSDTNDTFSGGFTNEAPKALAEPAIIAPTPLMPDASEQAN